MKISLFLFTIIITFLLVRPTFPQNQNSSTIYSLKTVLNDGESLIVKPLDWNLEDWLTFAALSGVTFGLHQYDEEIRKDAIKEPSLYKKPGFISARLYGDLWVGTALAAGLFSYGSIVDNDKCKLIGFELAESFLYSGIVSGALKIAAGRYRPNTNNGANSFIPFSLTTSRTSFPSGHTTIAMALSTVLAYNVDNIYLKVLIFIPPVFTASERILHNVHWTSDVFFGAAVGYFVSSYIVERHSDDKDDTKNYRLVPEISLQGRVGFTLIF